MITFPTEWKVIQNSKLPNFQTTNQLKNCPSSVAFPRLLNVDQLDSPYFLGENPGPTGRARRPPQFRNGGGCKAEMAAENGRNASFQWVSATKMAPLMSKKIWPSYANGKFWGRVASRLVSWRLDTNELVNCDWKPDLSMLTSHLSG